MYSATAGNLEVGKRAYAASLLVTSPRESGLIEDYKEILRDLKLVPRIGPWDFKN
jgi:hypothetical protein